MRTIFILAFFGGTTMFGNVFGKDISTVGDNPRVFRDAVLSIAKRQYPGDTLAVLPGDPDIIVVKSAHVGLQNLRAKFQQSDRSQATLEGLVKEHFALVLKDIVGADAIPDYEVAKARIRLQLMPKEYGSKAPLLASSFPDGLLVGLVLDHERGYRYLRQEDAARWSKELTELQKVAIDNLNSASKDIAVHSANNEEVRFIALETEDGFDAARILIPGFRQFVGEQIGKPFYFAIPNRDFLICWSLDSARSFQTFAREKVRKDFSEQPYPLSPSIFRVTENDEIQLAEQGAPVDAPKTARH